MMLDAAVSFELFGLVVVPHEPARG